MNTDEHGSTRRGIAGTKKQKNKSPRTHLSQVWSPAFRLPWVCSRLKPELRTSPQRRGERRRSSLGAHASSVLTVSRLLPEHARCVRSQENARKSFVFCQRISSRLRVFVVRFFGCGFAALCSSVFIRGFVLCEVWAENVKFSIDCVPVPRVG